MSMKLFMFYDKFNIHWTLNFICLEGKVDPTSNMSPEQLQFHYFNMHDLDKNGRLDGVELIKAITHFHAGMQINFVTFLFVGYIIISHLITTA